MKVKRKINLILTIILILTTCNITMTAEETATPAEEMAASMGAGWNLGNTLDSYSVYEQYAYEKYQITSMTKAEYYERFWGNPITTKEMIDTVKEGGFDSIRVPVTYFNHMDQEGNIDKAWLDRVEEVVNYVLDNDMKCIINVHHDTGIVAWIKADQASAAETEKKFERLWLQIAERFKKYDNDLLFEGYNELLNKANNWTEAKDSDYEVANKLNQVFVDTVRKTGYNNNKRILIVNTYAANIDQKTLEYFQLPKDSEPGRLIAGVHFYTSTEDMIFSAVNRIQAASRKHGVPFILSECSVYIPDIYNNAASMAAFLVKQANDRGIPCFWWDSGGQLVNQNYRQYVLLDRKNLTWHFPEVVKAFVNVNNEDDENNKDDEDLVGDDKDLINNGKIPYQIIECIEFVKSGGGFNTGYIADSKTSMAIDMEITDNRVYGDYLKAYSSSSNRLQLRQESTRGLVASYGWYSSTILKPEIGDRFVIRQDGEKTYIHSKLVRVSRVQNYNTGKSIRVGTCKMKVYGFEIKEGDQYVMKLVPVLDTNGKPCMYDEISGKLITCYHYKQ